MATITVTGAVGKDPELKFIKGKNGDFAVANFSLADSQRFNKGGEWQDGLTIWYNISTTGRQAEVVADAVSKGQKLEVTGELLITEYDAKDGTRKISYEIKATKITEPLKAQQRQKVVQDEPSWGSSWN
jgi:single-strand DNA-binding protein